MQKVERAALINAHLYRTLFIPALVVVMILPIMSFSHDVSADTPDIIRVAELALTNASGDKIKQVQVGEQVSILTVVTNTMDRDQQALILVEIRSGSGITEYLAWQSAKIRANSNYTFETSWVAENGCIVVTTDCDFNYKVRSFAITGFVNPRLLGWVNTLEGIAVIDTKQGSKLYRLQLNGTEYDIEYSMEGSYVRNIVADKPLVTLLVELGEVKMDTELTIKLGKDLIFETLACQTEFILESIHPEVFIDTIPAPIPAESIVEDNNTVTYHIKHIETGSKKIEIVGACLI